MSITNTKLWTALITPMDEQGDLHLDELVSLIRRQEEAGNGVLLLGSTGEGLALGLKEKKEVVQTAANLDLNIPLMVGVGGFNHRKQQQWITYCNQLDIEAFLLVTPLYAKPGPNGQERWFRMLLDAAKRPCMLYNVPSRTGTKMHPQVLEELHNHLNLEAMKDASGSVAKYQEFRKAAPSLAIYSGDDGLLPFFAAAGCHGLVSVVSNVGPKATRRYLEWSLAGRGPELLPLWQESTEALFSASNPVPAKKLLQEKGVISFAKYRPPLSADDVVDPEMLIETDRNITDWFKRTNQ